MILLWESRDSKEWDQPDQTVYTRTNTLQSLHTSASDRRNSKSYTLRPVRAAFSRATADGLRLWGRTGVRGFSPSHNENENEKERWRQKNVGSPTPPKPHPNFPSFHSTKKSGKNTVAKEKTLLSSVRQHTHTQEKKEWLGRAGVPRLGCKCREAAGQKLDWILNPNPRTGRVALRAV